MTHQCAQRGDPDYDPNNPEHDASRMLNVACPHPATVELDGRHYCSTHAWMLTQAEQWGAEHG